MALSNGAATVAGPESAFENDEHERPPRIGVIAVGGAGGNVLTKLYKKLPYLNRSIAIDTNPDALRCVTADLKILIGGEEMVWPGGARAVRSLANDTKAQIAEAVASLDIAFIVAGMGGTAGSVISPVVAEVLRSKRVMTIGAVITPSVFAGQLRQPIALAGTDALRRITNAVFPISNELPAQSVRRDGLLASSETAMFERLYRGVVMPFSEPGLVNIGSEDVWDVISQDGYSAMGYGSAIGKDAAETAARQAIAHPLLGKRRLRSASSGILFFVEGPPDALAGLGAVCRIIETIRNTIGDVDHEQFMICGANRNPTLTNEFRVTILAGGIDSA